MPGSKARIDWFKVGIAVQALRTGATIDQACQDSGLPSTTFRRWLASGRDLLAGTKAREEWSRDEQQYAAIAHQVDTLCADLTTLAYDGLRRVVMSTDPKTFGAVVSAARVILDRIQGPVTQRVDSRVQQDVDMHLTQGPPLISDEGIRMLTDEQLEAAIAKLDG